MSTNPVVLLHGALGSRSQLDPLKAALEQSGRKTFSMNFSGHSGESFGPSFGIEQFATDLLEFADQHLPASFDVFGYSMGGYVAMWFALHHPQRVGKIITLGTKFDWSPESARKEIRKMDAAKIREKVPAFARILEHRHAPNDWTIVLSRTADMMCALGERPLLTEERLREIKAGVSVCLGDQDDMADNAYSRHVADVLPKGSFVLLTDTPHPIEKVSLDSLQKLIL